MMMTVIIIYYACLVEFQDLLNFDDPLNVDAAEHYERDKVCLTIIVMIIIVIMN